MFNFFKKKKGPENLREVLDCFKNLEKDFEKLSQELENLKKESKFSIQKIGIVRFNPFKEVGGDQSFSIALLDGQDSGLVITSLYSREGNRVYGKPVKNGRPEYLLSAEERKAIAQANEVSIGRKMKTAFSAHNKAEYGNKNSKFNTKTTGSGGSGSC